MGILEALPSNVRETNKAPSDYWLGQSQGFQVFGPNGRIGFVALVVCAEGRVDGLLIRTGLFGTRDVFVPVDEVRSVVPRRQRLELLITPRVPRARIQDVVRELFAPAAETSRAVREANPSSSSTGSAAPARSP